MNPAKAQVPTPDLLLTASGFGPTSPSAGTVMTFIATVHNVREAQVLALL